MDLKQKLINYQANLKSKSQVEIDEANQELAKYSNEQVSKISTAVFFLTTLSALYQLSIKRPESVFELQDIVDEAFKMKSHLFGYQAFRPIIEDTLKVCVKSKCIILINDKYQLSDHCLFPIDRYLNYVLDDKTQFLSTSDHIKNTSKFMSDIVK